MKSVIESPRGMTYLDVRLKAGERWTYQPPEGHDVAWIASHEGLVLTPERVAKGEVAVFSHGEQPIHFEALDDAGFVLGSAARHPHDLVTGYYSVHSNAEALRRGEDNIAVLGRQLHQEGILGRRGA